VWIHEIQLRMKLFARPGCFSLCSINNNERNCCERVAGCHDVSTREFAVS